MNNKTIIEFGLLFIWRIMEISEGVIRLGQRPQRITPSSISIILHIRYSASFINWDYSTILTEPEVNNCFSIFTRSDLNRIRKKTIKKRLVWLTSEFMREHEAVNSGCVKVRSLQYCNATIPSYYSTTRLVLQSFLRTWLLRHVTWLT